MEFNYDGLLKQFASYREELEKIIALKKKSYCVVCNRESQFN